ncbi:hypothetical protein BB561_002460 [Smittium simulii]|uniref:SPRY domain-containing protein n=1 Tax=Smittium simulii TaxID=133385 RepID=A0A2T9YQI7_9FUNG|nr:hypothetical protein BB561_002460 [Smittium simulii]
MELLPNEASKPDIPAAPLTSLNSATHQPNSLSSGSESGLASEPTSSSELDYIPPSLSKPQKVTKPSHKPLSPSKPVEDISLDKSPLKNVTSNKCRYCQKSSAESLKTVCCLDCGARCHIDCIHFLQPFKDKILLGDDFFYFKCTYCADNIEQFKRYHLSWVDVVHIALFNLTHGSPDALKLLKAERPAKDKDISLFSAAEQGPQSYADSRVYFHYKADVSRFIDFNWSYFWNKPRGDTWINSASSALSTNSTENVAQDGRFESGKAKYNKNGMWALTDDSRFPSSYDLSQSQHRIRSVMFDISPSGSLIPIPDPKIYNSANNSTALSTLTNNPNSNTSKKKRRTDPELKSNSKSKKSKLKSAQNYNKSSLKPNGSLNDLASTKVAFTSYDENHVDLRSVKRPPVLANNYSYINPATSEWSVKMWPDLDNPLGPVFMQPEPTHSAPQMNFEGAKNLTLWSNGGYTVSKCSHGVTTGTYYYEAEILEGLKLTSNLRIGWGQISANLQAPCGYDHYSYSMRTNPGTVFHTSIGRMFGETLSAGDVLGVLVQLPEELNSDELEDIYSRTWDSLTPYKPFDYKQPKALSLLDADCFASPPQAESNNENTSEYQKHLELPPIPILENSEIAYFKNGECMGTAFRGLFLGKYYPMVSSYMGGKVKINFGNSKATDESKGFKFSPPKIWNSRQVKCIDSLEYIDDIPVQSENNTDNSIKSNTQESATDQNNYVSVNKESINDIQASNDITSSVNKESNDIISNVNKGSNDNTGSVNKEPNDIVNSVNTESNDIISNVNKESNDIISSVNKESNDIISSVNKESNDNTGSVNKEPNDIVNSVNTEFNDNTISINKESNDIISSVNKESNDIISS